MSLTTEGYVRLVEGFLATRSSANTRAAYARDLRVLADALGLASAVIDLARLDRVFGVEQDPVAQQAARAVGATDPAWLRDWRDALAGQPATRRRRVAAVRALCAWTADRFDVPDPAADLAPPAPSGGAQRLRREVVSLAPAATRALCEAAARPGARGQRDHALVELLYGCGLRASEAVGLDVSACHLDDPADPYVVVRGKGDVTRAVAVPSRARAALDAYLRVGRPALRAGARNAPRADVDAVFLSQTGRRLGRSDVWRIVTAAARRAGLSDDGGRVFPHALRHSCGTHLIQSGIDIRYVQAHLGHASPVTTEVYTHVTAAHLRGDFDRAHPRARVSASS